MAEDVDREKLYGEVWATPLTTLCKSYGLSYPEPLRQTEHSDSTAEPAMSDLSFDSGLPPMFLTADELVILTGRKRAARQIEALKAMYIPFLVNAVGQPVVTRVAIEGPRQTKAKPEGKWEPGLK